MKTRTFTIWLVAAILFLGGFSSAALAQEAVYIHPLRWDSGQTVFSDQEIIFVMGWASCRPGLVQNYLGAVSMTFILDGAALFTSKADANQNWGPIYETPPGPGAQQCPGAPEMIWRADWVYSIGALPAGDHSFYFSHSLDHSVTDTVDYDGDGRPDFWRGLTREREFTIHVEDSAQE